jgi:hypothetical protein
MNVSQKTPLLCFWLDFVRFLAALRFAMMLLSETMEHRRASS